MTLDQRASLIERCGRALREGVVQNIFSLYAVYCTGYLLALVTVPYLGRVLGPEWWGKLAFSQAFGGYLLLLMEYGFSLSGTREVARHRESRETLSDILAGVLGAKVLLALFSISICALMGPHVPVFRDHPALLWAAVFWAVMQGANALWFFQGLERMQVAVGLDAIAKTMAVVAIFVFVRRPEDAWKALAIQGTGSLLSLVLTLGIAYRGLPLRFPRRARVAESLRHGFTVFIPRNALLMYTVGNAFILGLFAPATVVGYYAGADRISRALVGLIGPVSDGIYPRISALAKRSVKEALGLFRMAFLLVGAAGVLMSVATFVAAPLLVRVILGPGYEPAALVLRILSVVAALKAFGNVLGINWMLPFGMDREFTVIVVAAGAINIGLGLALARPYEHIGMAWAVVASQAFAAVAAYVVLRFRRLNPLSRRTGQSAEQAPEPAWPVRQTVTEKP